MKKIFLIGHRSPDLDAVAAPVVYAHFLVKEQRYGNTLIIPTRTGEVNEETAYVFNKAGLELPQELTQFEITDNDEFILIDHNEESQRAEIVNNDKVIEVVDHHKLNINFNKPVRVTVMPLGSTCTVIYDLMSSHRIKPSIKILRLVLNSILSDTQGLKASTTTGIDSQVAHEIGKRLNVDLNKETLELFKAKSDITGLSPEQIVTKDYKIFTFGNKRVMINQVETVEPEKVLEQKEQLLNAIKLVKHKEHLDQLYVAITDVLNVNSQLIYETKEEEEVVKKAFMTHPQDNVADIGAKLSRKKDIAPPIEKAILE